jgi:hypothetical protein
VDGPDRDKSERIKLDSSWNQTTHLEVPSTHETLLCLRIDYQGSGSSANFFIFFRKIENLIPLKEPGSKTTILSEFVEVSSLVLF